MTTDINKQTLDAFRLNNFESLKSTLSNQLAMYIASKGLLSLDEFAQDGVLDLYSFRERFTSPDSFLGIDVLGPYIKQLTMPNGIPSNVADKMVAKINVSNFVQLKVLQNINGSVQFFTGDLSKLTTLETINLTADSYGNIFKMPVLSANPNLKSVSYVGNGFPTAATNVSVLNTASLDANLKLEYFSLQYFNVGTLSRTLVDEALISLKALKLKPNSAIKTVDFTGCKSPTGGVLNANYTWLKDNSVDVKLGDIA